MKTRTREAFWIDRAYDRDYAGPPPSRFRNYLLARRGAIEEATSEFGAAGWCVAVWGIATSPVMYPGFVRDAHDIVEASLERDDYGPNRVVLTVDVATDLFPGAWPAGVRAGWERDYSWSSTPGPFREVVLRSSRAPHAAVFVRVRALLEPPAPPDLRGDDKLWRGAEATVGRLVEQANQALSPVRSALMRDGES